MPDKVSPKRENENSFEAFQAAKSFLLKTWKHTAIVNVYFLKQFKLHLSSIKSVHMWTSKIFFSNIRHMNYAKAYTRTGARATPKRVWLVVFSYDGNLGEISG